MHYRRLGRSGLKISEISLGSWVTFGSQLNGDAVIDLVHAAFDQGVNFFDTADSYANGLAETLLGQAVGSLPRQDVVLSTKVFFPTSGSVNGRGLSRKHIFDSIHASLRRLNTDYVDLYFCHRYDPDTPMEEVVQTMDILVRQGKICYWGTSQWDASQVVQAFGVARQHGLIAPTAEQPQYNLFYRNRVERGMAPVCKEFGLGLTTWSPLAFGLLSGKYNEGIPANSRASQADMGWVRDEITPERLAMVRQLTALASDLEITTAQLALAWALRRKEVSSVITGATRIEQLDENLGAAEAEDRLSDDILEQIESIVGNEP